MKEVRTEIDISASREKVWSILTDFASHAGWNPFIKTWRGGTNEGDRLCIVLQPPGAKKAMSFCPTLLVFEENTELRWKGKLLFRGLFDGEHIFELESMGENSTKFIHREEFGGILVPFMGSVLKKTRQGFEAMNEALKTIAEFKTE